MAIARLLDVLFLESHKVLFLDLRCFLFILMISVMCKDLEFICLADDINIFLSFKNLELTVNSLVSF